MNLVSYTKNQPHTAVGEVSEALPGKYPEVATTPYWIEVMVAARKARGWTQTDLGRRVGVGQPTISKLETGESKTSALVHPICAILKIQLPYALINDEWERRWIQVGRDIRGQNDGMFKVQVKNAEAVREELERRTGDPEPH